MKYILLPALLLSLGLLQPSAPGPAGEEPSTTNKPDPQGGGCPSDMVLAGEACVDRYEAPNRRGALPLVMFTFYQARDWCEARGKRLCYDDEWTRACHGPDPREYPYGPGHRPGLCNDSKEWLQYDRIPLRSWPGSAANPRIESLDQLLTRAAVLNPLTEDSADHVRWLYQADPSGLRERCRSPEGVFDMVGNVEEWVQRRDEDARPEFTNRLMGRFWAEQRSCTQTVSAHGNAFRFYEIGFRCCKDPRL